MLPSGTEIESQWEPGLVDAEHPWSWHAARSRAQGAAPGDNAPKAGQQTFVRQTNEQTQFVLGGSASQREFKQQPKFTHVPHPQARWLM